MDVTQNSPGLQARAAPFKLAWVATIVSVGLLGTVPVRATELELPDAVQTHPDGRLPIQALFRAYLSLVEQGWQLDVLTQSQPPGRDYALPVIALRTPQSGEAVWIIAGMHGEEPAGPNAIAAAIDDIAAFGERRAVVLLPMNNPRVTPTTGAI